jgi:hypothetical protein
MGSAFAKAANPPDALRAERRNGIAKKGGQKRGSVAAVWMDARACATAVRNSEFGLAESVAAAPNAASETPSSARNSLRMLATKMPF